MKIYNQSAGLRLCTLQAAASKGRTSTCLAKEASPVKIPRGEEQDPLANLKEARSSLAMFQTMHDDRK